MAYTFILQIVELNITKYCKMKTSKTYINKKPRQIYPQKDK